MKQTLIEQNIAFFKIANNWACGAVPMYPLILLDLFSGYCMIVMIIVALLYHSCNTSVKTESLCDVTG